MNKEKRKNISFILAIALLLSVIPLTLLLNQDSVAEMTFPLEAVIGASPSLRIRSGASTNHDIIGSINHGEEVLLLEKVEGQDIFGNTRWYRIDYNNQDGYVSAYYVDIESWLPELPPAGLDPDFESYLESQGFPFSYRASLHALHEKYPDWEFIGVKLNASFNSAVAAQYVPGSRAKSLVPADKPASYKSMHSKDFDKKSNTWIEWEKGWVSASEAIIKHQLDPRNFLNEENILMFESLSYNEKVQNWQGVRNRLTNTFMDTDEYANIFMQAAHESGASPYHLISRVIIEVSRNGSIATNGNYEGYENYYNFYNIGAYGGTNPAVNGLEYAKNKGWNSRERAIIEGAKFISNSYINRYQNTIYFQRFNLQPGAYGGADHQYMTNLFAPETESSLMYTDHLNQNTLGAKKEFKIPIFASGLAEYPEPIPTTGTGTPNNWLRSIKVDGALLPGFQTSKYQYSLTMQAPNNEITINASPYNQYATVKGSGVYNLKPGKNPILLTVTATNGTQRYYEIVVNYEDETEDKVARVESDIYQIQPNGYIYGLDMKKGLNLAENALANIKTVDDTTISIVDNDGNNYSQGAIATGDCLLQSKDGKVVGSYIFILLGDVNGDGKIDILDADTICRYILNYIKLDDVHLSAANTLQDNEINILDVDIICRSILQYIEIQQTLDLISDR